MPSTLILFEFVSYLLQARTFTHPIPVLLLKVLNEGSLIFSDKDREDILLMSRRSYRGMITSVKKKNERR